MPELPDITIYLDALRPRVVGKRLDRARIKSPFLLRSVEPPIESIEGSLVTGLRRLGKRIVLAFEGDLFMVLHLMIAGRLHWKPIGTRPSGRIDLAAFDFSDGVLLLTEAGTKHRASLSIIKSERELAAHDPGGLDVFDSTLAAFARALRKQNRTIKRALTDPGLISGIGNAYSDEILFAAKMSPLRLTCAMSDAEIATLFAAARETLQRWINILRQDFGLEDGGPGRFPGTGDITAFRKDFAVHGRFGKPCPVCGHKVQRIVRADNEFNYCPTCQTEGKVLADRSLSRLLKDDWPRTVEEWESE